MNVEKSLNEIGEHVSLFSILTSLRFSSVGPLSGRRDGLRNRVYGFVLSIELERGVGLDDGRSSFDCSERLLDAEPDI
jgi:hypothetical protein